MPTIQPHRTLEERYPQRASFWRLKTQTLTFTRSPKLMGIINVTPDSFSDGGHFFSPESAIEQAMKLVDEGADILDVGGESTRPYADPIDADEELRRVIPVISRIRELTKVPISIDTSKAKVAAEAVSAGAEIINDVTGLEGDPAMATVALESKAGICAMHMQGTPQTMQDNPRYANVVFEILEYLKTRRDQLHSLGFDAERICLDPGIGFGKSHQHNLTLMANCDQFHQLQCPVLVGHSRKGFMGKILGDTKAPRTFASVGSSMALAQRGIQVLRVHDILPVRQAMRLFEACGGVDGRESSIE